MADRKALEEAIDALTSDLVPLAATDDDERFNEDDVYSSLTVGQARLILATILAALRETADTSLERAGEMRDVECAHSANIEHWTYSECRHCGSVHTGTAGWTIAKRQRFKNIAEARFYEKNGRLPDALPLTTEGSR